MHICKEDMKETTHGLAFDMTKQHEQQNPGLICDRGSKIKGENFN